MVDISYIIIDILILIFSSTGYLTSIGILLFIFYHRRQHPINTPILLICNTYVSIIYISFFLINMYSYNLVGDLYGNISFNNQWCYIQAYFLHVGLATLYHSYLLQGIYRFFRVVLYKQKQFQTYRFIFRLILIQWLLDFLLTLPSICLHHFQYIPGYYYCQLPYTIMKNLLLPATVTYYMPMIVIALIYFSIVYYMKRTKSQSIIQNRYRGNQRDLVVLNRIISLISLLFFISFPAFVIYMIYFITDYFYPLIYHFQWLSYTFALSILPIISAYLTPQLKNLFTNRWRTSRRA